MTSGRDYLLLKAHRNRYQRPASQALSSGIRTALLLLAILLVLSGFILGYWLH